MRWTAKTLTALALIVVSGCGAASARPGSGLESLPTLSGTPSPDPLGSRPAPPETSPTPLPTTVEKQQTGTTWVSLPWQLVHVTSGSQRVYLTYATGGCTSPGFVAVHESATDVTLTVWSQRINGPARCPLYARITYGWVALDAPLGDRALLHAPVTSGP
jgi:hypothetical protein